MGELKILEPVKIMITGLCLHNGVSIKLGQFAIATPEERQERTEELFAEIQSAITEERMVVFGNMMFDPTAFDSYLVT